MGEAASTASLTVEDIGKPIMNFEQILCETICKGFCPFLIKYWSVYHIVTKIEFFVARPIFQYKVDVHYATYFFNKKE